jgi:hypothetical protein
MCMYWEPEYRDPEEEVQDQEIGGRNGRWWSVCTQHGDEITGLRAMTRVSTPTWAETPTVRSRIEGQQSRGSEEK